MALLTPVKNFFQSLLGINQVINNTFASPVGNPAVYPAPNALRFVQDAYSGNASIYTIISFCARKFGSMPRYVFQVKDKASQRKMRALIKQKEYRLKDIIDLHKKAYDEVIVEDGKFAELIARPNPTQGQDAFFELVMIYKMATGEAFIHLNRGNIQGKTDAVIDKMQVLEMYVLPTQYVRIIPDPTNVWGCLGYEFLINGEPNFIRKNDIIHWKSPNPNFDGATRVHMRGLSPLEAGNALLTEDESATDASVAMQQNDGAKGFMYGKNITNMDTLQKSNIEGVINRKVNHRDKKGAVGVGYGDWGYLDFGQTSQEMQLIDARNNTFIRLCNLYGVPPGIFQTDTTYENMSQYMKALITNLLLPEGCSFRDELNRGLAKAFDLGNDTTHDIDVSMLPELQEDMAKLTTQLMNSDWLSYNEKREASGEEPLADPVMDEIFIANNKILIDDAALTGSLDSFSQDSGNSGKNTSNNLGKQSS